MPPKKRERTTPGPTPSATSTTTHNAAMNSAFRQTRRRRQAPRPPSDPWAITAPIDPQARRAWAWEEEDTLRGRTEEER